MSDPSKLVCGDCGKKGHFSPLVIAIVLYAPSLPYGYRLMQPDITGRDQRWILCGACTAAATFLLKAIAADPLASAALDWTHGTIWFNSPLCPPWMLERGSVEAPPAQA